MSAGLKARRVADDVFEFSVASPREAQALAAHLRRQNLAEDVVAGLATVSVRFDPDKFDDADAWLADGLGPIPEIETEVKPIELGVRYGGDAGPDFNEICTSLNLTREALIDLHAQAEHAVEMIGFTPGFSYISGLPEQLNVPRLSAPRPRVPAGSVGISGAFTGIYALDGPGGWPIIGQVDRHLFDARSDTPFLLSPGQRLKFKAV